MIRADEYDERLWERDIPWFTEAEPYLGRSSKFVYRFEHLAADDPRRCQATYPIRYTSGREPTRVVCAHYAGHEGPHLPASIELIEEMQVVVASWGTAATSSTSRGEA